VIDVQDTVQGTVPQDILSNLSDIVNALEGIFTTLYGAPMTCDNCLDVYNPSQEDTDGDGIGNACEGCIDNDRDNVDTCDEPYGYSLDGCDDPCDCDDTDPQLTTNCSNDCDDDCQQPVRIEAQKVVCEDEMYLPNWGDEIDSPGQILANTASDYVTAINTEYDDEVCWLEDGWQFQYGFLD